MKHKAILCTALCCTLAGTCIGFAAGTNAFSVIADLFGDINSDGDINASDASDLLQYCAYKGAGGEQELKAWLGGAAEDAPTVTGSIETREVYVDYDGDGTLEVADGAAFYLVLDGSYDTCAVEIREYGPEDDEGYALDPITTTEKEVKLCEGSSIFKLECKVTPYKGDTAGETQTVVWNAVTSADTPTVSGSIETREVYVDYDGDGTLEVADGAAYYLVLDGTFDKVLVKASGYGPEDSVGYSLDPFTSDKKEIKLCEGSSIYRIVCKVTPYIGENAGEEITVNWQMNN